MFGYIVSARDNKVLISSSDEPENIFEKKVDKEVVSGSEILDDELFAKELGELIIEEFGPNPEKRPLYFLVEPSEVILSFITNDKNKSNGEDYLLDESSKIVARQGLGLEDVYFSYQKIAPFVYQFVAIKKLNLETYLSVAGDLDFELRSVIPWVSLLPKSLKNVSQSKVFVIKNNVDELVVFTEFGGVRGIENIDKIDESKLIEKEKVDWDENIHGFFTEIYNDDVMRSQINLLNLFPLPVEENKPKALVYIGSTATAALLIAGVFFGINYAKNNNEPNDVLGGNQEVDVEVVTSDKNVEDTQVEEAPVEETTQENPEDVTEEFSRREYLRVKVLNSTQTVGLAGNISQYLNGLGYDTVAPADYSEALENTLIKLNPDFANYEDILREDLAEEFDNIEVTTDLEEGLDYNALIILGNTN